MADTILTFGDYADETTEYLTLPRLPRTPIHTHRRAQTYAEYLAEWNLRYRGEALPPKPTGDLPPAEAFVNCGRWVWQCVCGTALAVEPGEDLICVRCGLGGWRSVVWPGFREEIESQLLSLPGHRQNAPLREWRTVWSVDDLRTRVAKADALIGEGVEFPRALSIGGTRVWVTGEILTAANMNQYISQVMEDLAGRNGLIEFEDSISFPDSATNPFRLPRGTTGQRPASPLNAMMRYNTTLNQVEFYNGSWTPLPTDAATFSYLDSQGLIGTGSGQLAVGNHFHAFTQTTPDGSFRSLSSFTFTAALGNYAQVGSGEQILFTPSSANTRVLVGILRPYTLASSITSATDFAIFKRVHQTYSNSFSDYTVTDIDYSMPAYSTSHTGGDLLLLGFDTLTDTTPVRYWLGGRKSVTGGIAFSAGAAFVGEFRLA